jgi:energy-coupling factor transport system ATP-binding protein
VRDDIVWGLDDPSGIDVDAALDRVGLQPLADRETATLSGGELQRLAIASALVRDPQLLVSDESTAMVDAEGRRTLVALLRSLADEGTTVVHVSHYPSEAAAADRTIALDHGRVVAAAPNPTNGEDPPHRHARGGPVIELRGVGHVYSRNTPWANRALTDVNLTIRAGESVLVVGHNGSGKSTLAWILAGLTRPSEGEALLRGKPISEQVRTVGLSFQHARLQLLRPVVVDEVRVAAGVNDREARAALDAVGLGAGFGERRVDELSGGQMRRVVLAGVLAAKPRAIVLDEPFAGLDADGRADLEHLLVDVRDTHGIALVIVSHDRDLPPALVERIVELDGGRIVRDDDVVDGVHS